MAAASPRKWIVKSIRKMPPKYQGAPRPTVAVAGRSNVGKSTLINALLGKKIAATSKTPGRTRGVQRLLINEQFDLIDLPGYGFAKVNEDLRRRWRDMVTDFLSGHGNLRQVLVLVDMRRGLGDLDAEMLEWAKLEGVGASIVLTKADKLKRMHQAKTIQEVTRAAGEGVRIFPVSAVKGDGLDALKRALTGWYSEDSFAS